MSILLIDVIDRLPGELQARLEADEFFADIPVVVAEEGNVAAELARKQALITEKGGKRGVAVVVLQVIADDPYAEVKFGPMVLRPAFQVVENVEINRGNGGTQKSGRRVARRIVDVIKSAGLGGLTTDFAMDKPGIEPIEVGEMGSLVKAYQVNFVTYEDSGTTASQVEAPAISAVEGAATPQVEMTCGTADAAIWYTLDESYPAPGRVGSVEYSGPIEIPVAGFVIRAAAYKTGLIASQVVRAEVSYS